MRRWSTKVYQFSSTVLCVQLRPSFAPTDVESQLGGGVAAIVISTAAIGS